MARRAVAAIAAAERDAEPLQSRHQPGANSDYSRTRAWRSPGGPGRRMSAGYPVVLRLAGRRCVVVGGGSVASRKVGTLVRSGADVLVVAPEVAPEIESFVATGGVRVEHRPFEP